MQAWEHFKYSEEKSDSKFSTNMSCKTALALTLMAAAFLTLPNTFLTPSYHRLMPEPYIFFLKYGIYSPGQSLGLLYKQHWDNLIHFGCLSVTLCRPTAWKCRQAQNIYLSLSPLKKKTFFYLTSFQSIGPQGWWFYKAICPSVRLSVCSLFEVPFKRLFAPTSRSQMSNIFRNLESFGNIYGKKWSQNNLKKKL